MQIIGLWFYWFILKEIGSQGNRAGYEEVESDCSSVIHKIQSIILSTQVEKPYSNVIHKNTVHIQGVHRMGAGRFKTHPVQRHIPSNPYYGSRTPRPLYLIFHPQASKGADIFFYKTAMVMNYKGPKGRPYIICYIV